ncbi:MAG: hypothetical protein KDA87_26280, partial [Planctomycetales bacterium]|nr:hypothetical protein [Planctomycetales bacterium]
SIEPDDYAEGSSVAHAISGVTLSAANFRNTPTSDVTAVTETLSSTGTKAFGNDQGTAWTNTHRLRMDFDSPVSFVSVDVIGSRSSSESAIIIGYDSEGRQLVGAQSEGLFEGDTDTISISRAEADISYAIAYTVSIAVDGTARFDNLQFDGLLQEPTAASGSTGAYSFGPLANGAYDVRVDTNAGESITTPAAGFVSVTLDAPSENANLNLGISSESVSTWHNAASPMDVNNDGFIVPFDAILIINELNGPQHSDSVTGQLDTPPNPVPAFFDVNNDGFVAPIDVIMIINYLNANPAAGVAAVADQAGDESIADAAEGEAVVDSHVASAVLSQDVKRNVAASMDLAFADIDTDPQPGKRPFWLSE